MKYMICVLCILKAEDDADVGGAEGTRAVSATPGNGA